MKGPSGTLLKRFWNMRNMRLILLKTDHQVLKCSHANTYDIVLCDIKMAKMDGIEVLQKIYESSC